MSATFETALAERAAAMGIRGQKKVRAEFVLPDCVRQLVARLDAENRT